MAHRLTGPRRYAELSGGSQPTETNQPPTTHQAQTTAFQHKPAAFQHQTPADQAPAISPYANQTKSQQFTYDQQPGWNFTSPHSNAQQAGGYDNTGGMVEGAVPYRQGAAATSTAATRVTSTPSSEQRPRRKSSKSRQIDTDKIPRPQITADSSYAPKSYVTSTFGVPPSSFSPYYTVDEGNAGPRYIRSTYYKVPTEESIVNQTHVPLGLIIQPLADPTPEEEGVSLVDYGEAGPVRCNRCRAYINPNWIFTQNGSVGVCNLCRMNNEIPKEYYCPLDEAGSRRDRLEKPELCKGVYEFLAPSSYHVRPLVTPNIIFCIEASSATYLSGILHQLFSSLQNLLDYIPSPELTKICIVTYDTGINFFKVPEDLTKEVSVIHVPDSETPCLPYPKNHLFLSLQDDREKINYLIERILKHYESSEKIQKGVHGTCLGAAVVDCCDMLLKDGGRVLAFTTHAPATGLGKLKRRDDYKLYGTDKEKTLYVPQVEDYAQWGKKYLENRVSLDLFCFAPEYFDLTTVGQLCGITGGNIYYYPSYKGNYDGEKLHYDLARNLTRYVGYDAVMTIRTCQGISFLDYVTPTGRRPVPEIEFASIDADTTLNVYLKHEEKLTGDDVSYQVAMLYTNPYGQRVIRVINFKTTTSNDFLTIFKSCDVETVAQLILKRNFLNITTTAIPQIRKSLVDTLVNVLYAYRYNCASTSSPAQLILPDSLKVLPVYFLAAFKSHILRVGGDTRPDDRAFDLFRFCKMPLNVLSNTFYIKIYPLHTIWTDEEYSPGTIVDNRTIMSGTLAATDEKIDDNGIYLLDNGEFIYLYVKKLADPIFLQHLFGVETYAEVANLTSFPEYIESEYFTKVSNIIDQLRKNKNSSYQAVRIVTEKDPFEPHLLNLLVEDERLGESYSGFLVNTHKAIQEKLS